MIVLHIDVCASFKHFLAGGGCLYLKGVIPPYFCLFFF